MRVPRVEPIRLPWEPLYQAAGAPSFRHLRTVLRTEHGLLQRAAEQGVTLNQADIWCSRLGLVPYVVWPEWITIALEQYHQPVLS